MFIGPGDGVLACGCGNTLIEGYEPARFLAIGIQCEQCGAVTETPGLAAGARPPFAVVIAEAAAEPRVSVTTLPPSAYVIGRGEMDRITALLLPRTPDDNVYLMSAPLLDHVAAEFARLQGADLPVFDVVPGDDFAGMREHALGWAVSHVRRRLAAEAWSCRDSAATSAAVVNIAGFLHFVRTWGHHPLFAAMAATAGDRGFSLHGLAAFAAAHCLSLQGNRIGFPEPEGFPGRIEHFYVATGPTETVTVLTDVFDRFEHPYGRARDAAGLRAAVMDVVFALAGRINLKHPGLLLLSPGLALDGFDEALIEAVKAAVQAVGRKNRGLMAVAPMVLRMQAMADRHALRFGYGIFPVENRYYQGDGLVQAGG